jgi:hypothetical protein
MQQHLGTLWAQVIAVFERLPKVKEKKIKSRE